MENLMLRNKYFIKKSEIFLFAGQVFDNSRWKKLSYKISIKSQIKL